MNTWPNVLFVILAMDFTDLDDDDKDLDYKPESESEDDLESSRDSPTDNNMMEGILNF
jgi:hypothetical protein